MASFAWYLASEDLAQRYASLEGDDVDRAAVGAWQAFIGAVAGSSLPDWQAGIRHSCWGSAIAITSP